MLEPTNNKYQLSLMSNSPNLVKVAVPIPLRRLFDYQYQDSQKPMIGGRVLVPFGRQQLVGYVIGFSEESDYDLKKIKHIVKVIDQESLLDKELFNFIQWSAQYYQHPIGEVFNACLPSLIGKGEIAQLEPEYFWQLTNEGEKAQPKSNAVKQIALLKLAQSHQSYLTQETLKAHEFVPGDLKSLINNGWLTKEIKPLDTGFTQPKVLPSTFEPNKEQHQAIAQIFAKKAQFQPFLLDGVTSSGKTEVYLRAITHQLEAGKQTLVLVPEIGLTPQTIQRFKERFHSNISMLHSGMTDKQRLNEWLKAKQGLTSIIIGTRSALFTPFKDLGLIVIDEEHDLSFKQQEGFRYSARDLALVRANNLNIPIIMGSATPSIESQYNVSNGRFERLTLSRRAGNAKAPHSKIFDVRQRPLNEGISKPLREHIESHLAKGQQCLVFLNRRGFAPSILCHDCGWIAECNRCDRNMTYHQQLKRLHCHHCDRQVFLPKQCPSCQSDQLLPIGLGTERLAEALSSMFPKHKVIRVDRDSTRRKDSMQNIVEEIKRGEADIIVGTQMLAKGHHFPNLTLVAVIDIDGCLFSADFRATERTAQLLTQVAGRAGRGEANGEIVIQSHHPDHPLLVNLFTQNYQQLSEQMLQERKTANLPPYSAQVLIRSQATNLAKPMEFLQDMANILNQYPQLEVYGPYPAPMIKRAGKMRAQLLLQASDKQTIQKILNAALPVIEEQKSAKNVRWSIDVDPQEVF